MNFIELIGLLILVLALLAPVLRRILEERARQQDPEGYKKMKEAQARQMREEFGYLILEDEKEETDEEETHWVPPEAIFTPETVVEKQEYHTLDARFGPIGATLEESEDAIKPARGKSKISSLMRSLDSPSDLVLLREILGEPPGFREEAAFTYLQKENRR